VKSNFSCFRRFATIGLLAINATFLACSNSDGSSGTSAGSSGADAASGANQGHGGNAAAGHSGDEGLGGGAQGGANAGGAAHAGSAGTNAGGMSSVSGSGGAAGSAAAAGSPNAGSGGSAGGTSGANAGGASGGGHGGSAGAGPTISATQAIFDQHCINCHDASKTGLPAYPGLPLTAGAAYAALVSHPADQTCGGTRVVPSDSAHSYLFRKLSDATPCSGAQMPRKPEVGPTAPLSATELETIRAWIDGGAHP
jgi:hypothetical protein